MLPSAGPGAEGHPDGTAAVRPEWSDRGPEAATARRSGQGENPPAGAGKVRPVRNAGMMINVEGSF